MVYVIVDTHLICRAVYIDIDMYIYIFIYYYCSIVSLLLGDQQFMLVRCLLRIAFLGPFGVEGAGRSV